jgi:hydrogenase maturation factor
MEDACMPSDDFDEKLGLGKVSSEVLRRSVLSLMPTQRKITLDAAEVTLQGNIVVAHSPSIGVPLEALGFFAFHYAASNVAARLARPKHLVNGIYLPLETRERDLRRIAGGLGAEARKYGVNVVAGQTATYAGLEIPLVTVTCMGEPVGTPEAPEPGDRVLLVGEVGGEALWLKSVSEGGGGEAWRRFTPLPAALSLIECEGVRLMHDVSEGGVKNALQEVGEAFNVQMDVDGETIIYSPGVEAIGQDSLRVPTYGTLIVVSRPDAVDDVMSVMGGLGVPCSPIGVVEAGEGVYIDGEKVDPYTRVSLDEVYGSFRK